MNSFLRLAASEMDDDQGRPPAGGDARPTPPPEAYVNEFVEPAGPARESVFRSVAELEGQPEPEREWVVPGMVPAHNVTLLSGDGGTGKSLLALQLAVAVVTGRDWLGKTVKPGRALYLAAEDDDAELHRRFGDILRAVGLSFKDAAGLTYRSVAGEDALLAVDSQLALMKTELFRELERRAEAEAPHLIIIDTLADTYPANENDRAKVRQFIGLLRGLAIRRKCAVILLAHPSLTGLNSGSGTSGSTAWNNSVRSRLYVSRVMSDGYEADTRRRVLSLKKANYGETGGEIGLTWQEGVFVPDAAETSLDRMAAGAKAERVFLKLLRTFTDQGRRVNHAGGTTYAPNLFSEHPDSEGLTKRAFKGAMEGLLAAGKVKIETEGPASRRVSYLTECAQ